MYINCFFLEKNRIDSIFFDNKNQIKLIDKIGYKRIIIHQIKKIDGKIIVDD